LVMDKTPRPTHLVQAPQVQMEALLLAIGGNMANEWQTELAIDEALEDAAFAPKAADQVTLEKSLAQLAEADFENQTAVAELDEFAGYLMRRIDALEATVQLLMLERDARGAK